MASVKEKNFTSNSIFCGICSQILDRLTLLEREEHYECHFRNKSPSTILHAGESISKKRPHKPCELFRKVKRKWLDDKENDSFWYPSKATHPPQNYTPGIIPLLNRYLCKCHTEGITLRAALCYKDSVHINRKLWDASWGCGYRNFMMACAVLIDQSFQPLYFPLLDAPIEPGVRNLQTWIELAWQNGFDREGAQELNALVGTNKWIGTSDIWVAFSSRGIPAELVDFNLKNHPRGVEILIDWVVDYFSPTCKGATIHDALHEASPIANTDRMPLILQDHRHSRTIVGYEVSRDGTVNLLMFDPAFIPDASLRNLALSSLTFSPHATSSMSTNQFIHTNHTCSNGIQHNAHKPPSGTSSLSTHDENHAERTRRFSLPDGQNSGDKALLQEGQGSEILGRTVESGASLSRQQFSHFRLSPKRLNKKKYQILYFPMSAPLSDQERIQKRVVTSKKIC